MTAFAISVALCAIVAATPASALPGITPQPNATTVFAAGLAGVACYRIPSITQTDKGTLLAFAEARHSSCADSAVQGIAVRRSTDGGRSWSDVATAVGNASYLVGNPTSVYVHPTKTSSAPARVMLSALRTVQRDHRAPG